MKTQHCDECKHATMRALPKPTLVCAMLHKPRFYAPVYWLKDSWGWKRKCEDFVNKVAQAEGAQHMTKEEIDILWNKAMRLSIEDGDQFTRYRFAELVSEAEREACAKVCESLFDMDDDSCNEAEQCAAAIRARKN